MPFFLHIYLHFFIALIIGYLAGRYFKRPWLCLVVAISGGFLIDLDHLLEYFLVFGPQLNLTHFFQGREFLTSGLIHLWFHAWEWLALLAVLAWLLAKKRTVKIILLTLALAMAGHMISDSLINHYPFKFYSLSYRAAQYFSAERLLSPEQYQENMELKEELGI